MISNSDFRTIITNCTPWLTLNNYVIVTSLTSSNGLNRDISAKRDNYLRQMRTNISDLQEMSELDMKTILRCLAVTSVANIS